MIESNKFQHFVYLGVGDDSACFATLNIQSDRYVLIEADTELTDTWNLPSLENRNVKVINKAVVTEFDTNNEFKRFNLEEFNGFYESDALTELYPGLKLKEHVMFPNILFADVFNEIPEGSNTYLVIDIPLQYDFLLQSFLANKLFQKVAKLKFSLLTLSGDSDLEMLYERITQMEDIGFVLESTEQKDDFTYITLQRSRRIAELFERAKSSDTAIKKMRVDAKKNNESQNKKYAQLLTKLELKIQKLNTKTKTLEDSKSQIKTLVVDRDKASESRDVEKANNKELTQTSKMLNTEIANLRVQLADIQKESKTGRDLFNKQIKSLTADRTSITNKLKIQTQFIDDSQTALDKLKFQIISLTDEFDQEQELKSAKKATNNNVIQASKALQSELTDLIAQLEIIHKESEIIRIEQLDNIKNGSVELEKIRAERDAARKERNEAREILEQNKTQLVKLNQQFEGTLSQVNIVKIENNTIKNQQFEYLTQQKLLETQLIKVEAHLDIITELLIKPKNND
jgi:hypothetical protein